MAFLPALAGYHRETGAFARLHVSPTGRNNDRRRLTFHFSRALIELAGWQGGERFVVGLGIGADLGAFQISRVTKARAGLRLIPQSNARGFRLLITLPPVIHGVRPAEFIDRLRLPATLDFTIDGEAMVLRPALEHLPQGDSHTARPFLPH